MNLFVILFQGRSGSTYLVECLDDHPLIHATGEELIVCRAQGSEAQKMQTRKIFSRRLMKPCCAIGFKTKLEDVEDQPGFARLLEELQVRVILLRRRNAIKHVVSWINAERLHAATGDWNVYQESSRCTSLHIDIEDFDRRLRQLEVGKLRLENYVADLRLPVMDVFYEDLLRNEELFIQKLLLFIGVPFAPIKGRSLKNTSDALQSAIINFRELRDRYVGTLYENQFDEIAAISGDEVPRQ